jgi:putative zinc finger/helix-turn-helix YgiT family protein
MKCPNCGKEMKSKVRDYEYVESGLKNVVLSGITVHECKHCGEVLPEIRNIKQVHQWIAEYLIKKQGVLTGAEFRFLRKAMGKSAKEIAECLAVNPVTISRWENDKEKIGPQSDRLLRMAFILDPTEARLFAAPKLLEFARETLARTIATRKRAKPEKIVITPSHIRQGEIGAHE